MLYPVNEAAVECGKQNTAEFFRLHIFFRKRVGVEGRSNVSLFYFSESINHIFLCTEERCFSLVHIVNRYKK